MEYCPACSSCAARLSRTVRTNSVGVRLAMACSLRYSVDRSMPISALNCSMS